MAKTNKFEKVSVNSLDIQPKGLDFDLTAINDMIREIAERNDMQPGDSINADVEYEYKGKIYESVTTISYDGKELVAVGGYEAVNFDKGEDYTPEA